MKKNLIRKSIICYKRLFLVSKNSKRWRKLGIRNICFRNKISRPFAYIRKAHLEEDLRKAVRRYWKESREEPIYVIVKDGKKNILVDPYHIDYLQANGHYIDIIMDNEEPIVVRNHINELQHTLEKYGFVRVQVSYLVNVKFIERFDGKNVYLRNGIKKFVSPRFEKQLLEKLRSYMESDGDDLNGDTG